MPQPYLSPEEENLVRMVRESGSPHGAARDLLARIEALEAAVAAAQAEQEADAEEASPETPGAERRATDR
jgi:hypothetical protein